jgi:YVTN family beta-propeller protein
MSDQGLPPQVLTEIGSPIRETRLTGVDALARLATGADLAMAAAARQALKRLTEDDSRSVATAAASALERTTVRVSPDRVDFGQVLPGTAQMVADVLVDGPPLAVATATVTTSGPGLRAMLNGRQLRIAWLPQSPSDWLDGLVTVRGPGGWADVHVTGQVTDVARPPHPTLGAPMGPVDEDGLPVERIRVFSSATPPQRRRRVGSVVLIAAITALVLVGGAGVAMALTDRKPNTSRPPVTALGTRPPASSEEALPEASPTTIQRVPLAARVASLDTPTLLRTIAVGAEPEGVAVSPDGRTVYVANQSSHVLSVINAGTRRVTAVPLRNTPRFVATSRDGRQVFVSMYENDKSGSGVAVVDGTRAKVLRYLSTGVQPYALSVSPEGDLWVPIHSEHRVEVYTAGDQQAAGQINVPANPHAVGFSADQLRAFTPNHESNVVSVIDMRSDRLLKSIPVSKSPHSLAVSPDGRTVLVAGYDANTADLIDAVTLKRTGPFKVGKQPQSVAFAADGAHAYVVNEGDNTVSVVDGHTGRVTSTVKVGRSPRTVAVSPDGRLAYVSNGDDNTVTVLTVGR